MSSLFTMRAWLVLVGICIMGSLNAFLISKEHIETVMVEDNDIEYDDRLGDLVYSKGNRESNLSSFGLNSDQIKESKKYFRRYEKMETQIRARLKKSDEDLTEVFCSRTEEIRPRYAGLQYLILEDNGERIVWDPKSNNEFNITLHSYPRGVITPRGDGAAKNEKYKSDSKIFDGWTDKFRTDGN